MSFNVETRERSPMFLQKVKADSWEKQARGKEQVALLRGKPCRLQRGDRTIAVTQQEAGLKCPSAFSQMWS